MFIMVLDVGLFGVLTGFLANACLEPPEKVEEDLGEIDDARKQIAEFRQLLDEQEKTNAALKAKFEALENLIEVS